MRRDAEDAVDSDSLMELYEIVYLRPEAHFVRRIGLHLRLASENYCVFHGDPACRSLVGVGIDKPPCVARCAVIQGAVEPLPQCPREACSRQIEPTHPVAGEREIAVHIAAHAADVQR